MQQRREWREKSGGVLEEVDEANEAEDGTEDVGEIDANGEGVAAVVASLEAG